MITIYGIKSCDTVRKARKYLDSADRDHQYHDFRIDGLEKEKLYNWSRLLGWKKLLNTRSTSWRQLSDEQKNNLTESTALTLMLDNPTLIKRPITEYDDKLFVGFKETEYQQLL